MNTSNNADTNHTKQSTKKAIHMPHIIIIGATSGIGLALATSHLHNGWQVTIVGSNADKIVKLQETLQPQYTDLLAIYQCDISNPHELQALFSTLEKTPFNQLVYSAGWYLNERKLTLSHADSNKMLAVNLQAFNQVFYWASEQLKPSKVTNKKLVCIASVAGLLDYPDASLYAKCKNAMIATSQAYAMGLKPFGIDVICIASGYVDTQQLKRLNDGDTSHKPFVISENQAIQEIHYAIDNNLVVHCFPKPIKRLVSLLGCLPKSWLNKAMRWQYRQQDGR